MEVEQLTIPREKAEEIYQESREALKHHAAAKKSQFLKDLRSVTNQLRRKRKILDLEASIIKGGLLESKEPKLCIAPADQDIGYFRKLEKGAGVFRRRTGWRGRGQWRSPNLKDEFSFPQGTFPEWPTEPDRTWRIHRENIEIITPAIPPKILLLIPKHHTLKGYHILWEVEKWEPTRVPKDPILLKQVTAKLFAVIGTWNLTKLERAIMRGRL